MCKYTQILRLAGAAAAFSNLLNIVDGEQQRRICQSILCVFEFLHCIKSCIGWAVTIQILREQTAISVQHHADHACNRYDFNGRMRRMFESMCITSDAPILLLNKCIGNRNLTNPEEIEKALKLGEYIKNGACSCRSLYISWLTRASRNSCSIQTEEISTSQTNV